MDYLQQADTIAQYFQASSGGDHEGIDYDAILQRLPTTIAMAFEAEAVALPIYYKARRGEGDLGLIDKNDRAYSSPLTIADTQVHERTFELYFSNFPDDKFEGEEGKHIAKNARVTIVQDEIDATQNYALGYGSFSYVNALYIADDIKGEDHHASSLVYNPLQRVLFMAVLGRGAFRFELSQDYAIVHQRAIQVANLDVRATATSAYILMDTMGLADEDPVLRRVLQRLGYKVEPQSGSGLKVAVVASESAVCAVFRSQRGNPDPWDIAAASLLVTEGRASDADWQHTRGIATSLSGGRILNAERKFYDGYAIGAPLAHAHIVTANTLIERVLTQKGTTQKDMTPTEWDALAETVAAEVRAQYF